MSTASVLHQNGLFRVLYCSRNRTGVGAGEGDGELSSILLTSRTNNRACGITGALLFNAGYFAQVLEGPKLAIERTFERIQRDDRHNDVTVLECSDIGSRDFPDWSMARIAPISEVDAAAAREALFAAMDDPGQAGRDVLELMRNLVVEAD